MITKERLDWILLAIERERLSRKEKELVERFEELGLKGVELNRNILEEWNKDVDGPDKQDESLSDALERIFRECILRKSREERKVKEWID